jgi:hypothetical protein
MSKLNTMLGTYTSTDYEGYHYRVYILRNKKTGFLTGVAEDYKGDLEVTKETKDCLKLMESEKFLPTKDHEMENVLDKIVQYDLKYTCPGETSVRLEFEKVENGFQPCFYHMCTDRVDKYNVITND